MRAVLINERTDKGGVLGRPITPVTGMTSSLKGTFNAGTNIATMNMKGISNKLKLVNDALVGAAQNIEQADQTIEKIEETSSEIDTISNTLTSNYWDLWLSKPLSNEASNVQMLATAAALDRSRERLIGETVDPYPISDGLILPRGFYLTSYFNSVSYILPSYGSFSKNQNVSPYMDKYGYRLPDGGYVALISTILQDQSYYYGEYVKNAFLQTYQYTYQHYVGRPYVRQEIFDAQVVRWWYLRRNANWLQPASNIFIRLQYPGWVNNVQEFYDGRWDVAGNQYYINTPYGQYKATDPLQGDACSQERVPSSIILNTSYNNGTIYSMDDCVQGWYDSEGRYYESLGVYGVGGDTYGYGTGTPVRGRVSGWYEMPHIFYDYIDQQGNPMLETDGRSHWQDIFYENANTILFRMLASKVLVIPTYNLHTEFVKYNKNLLNVKPNQIGGRNIIATWVWRTTCNFGSGSYVAVQILVQCEGESSPRLLLERNNVKYSAHSSDTYFKSIEQVIYNFNPDGYGDFLTSDGKGKITEIFATTFDGHTISYRPYTSINAKYDYIETTFDKWYSGY